MDLAGFFGGVAVGEERADEVFDAGEDLVEGEDGGVDDDGVRGGVERGVGAIAVTLVALAEFLKDSGAIVAGGG